MRDGRKLLVSGSSSAEAKEIRLDRGVRKSHYHVSDLQLAVPAVRVDRDSGLGTSTGKSVSS